MNLTSIFPTLSHKPAFGTRPTRKAVFRLGRVMSGFASAVAVVLFLGSPTTARADDRVPLDEAAKKTGDFELKLTERSPLSDLGAMSKRVAFPKAPTDYDLTKQWLRIFVPAKPDAAGKYGLVVALPFVGGHGFAPKEFIPVLENHHLIWIGSQINGDEQPPAQRLGTLLDSVHNAKKAFPIDDTRVYAYVASGSGVETTVGMLYPDVFTGVLQSGQLTWFAKIKSGRNIWSTDTVSKPADPYFGQSKAHVKFFFVYNDTYDQNFKTMQSLILKQGYLKDGFKHVKMIETPGAGLSVWSTFSGDWFDQGIQFLDDRTGVPALAAKGDAGGNAATPASPAAPGDATAAATPPATPPATSPPTGGAGKAAGGKATPAKPPATPGKAATTPPKPATAPAVEKPAPPSREPPTKEEQANRALSLAKSYVAARRYELAKPKLQKIITDFPNTPIAAEAQKVLDDIADK